MVALVEVVVSVVVTAVAMVELLEPLVFVEGEDEVCRNDDAGKDDEGS